MQTDANPDKGDSSLLGMFEGTFGTTVVINKAEKVGIGNVAVCFAAFSDGCRVVCKVTQAKGSCVRNKIMRNEVAVLSRVRHENIIGLVDWMCDEDHRTMYMAMEMCTNGDLMDWFTDRCRTHMSENDTVYFCTGVLRAVEFLHGMNYMHRDIKADNVLIDAHLTPKLCDFEFAKDLGSKDGVCYSIKGTTSYMAPEIFSGGYSYPADVWALVCMVYSLLEGVMPFNTSDGCARKKSLYTSHRPPRIAGLRARSLFDAVFVEDPSARPSARDMLGLDFFKLRARKPSVRGRAVVVQQTSV